MAVYILVYFILLFLSLADNRKNRITVFIFASAILLFMGVTRAFSVGMDVSGYAMIFDEITSDPDSWNQYTLLEPGFNYLMAWYKEHVSLDPMSWIRLLFIIYFLGIFVLLKRYCISPVLGLFLLFALTHYFSSYNIIRQTLAFSLISLFLPLLLEKKKVLWFTLVVILISYFLHTSQVILLLFILPVVYPDAKFFKAKNMIFLLIASFVVAAIGKSMMVSILSRLGMVAQFLGERYVGYLTYNDWSEISGIQNFIHTVFCIFVVYMNRNRKDVFLVVYVFGIVLLNLLGMVGWIFIRLAIPLYTFRIISVANLWYEVPGKYSRLLFRIVVIIYSLGVFAHRILTDRNDVVPYVSDIFN